MDIAICKSPRRGHPACRWLHSRNLTSVASDREHDVEAKLPVLTIDGGPNDGETMPIAKPVTSLGRGDENDIVIKRPGRVKKPCRGFDLRYRGYPARPGEYERNSRERGRRLWNAALAATRGRDSPRQLQSVRRLSFRRRLHGEDAGNRPGRSRHGP